VYMWDKKLTTCSPLTLIQSFIHSFIAISRAHYVDNVESEALVVSSWQSSKFLSCA